jgi:hypothetical protein
MLEAVDKAGAPPKSMKDIQQLFSVIEPLTRSKNAVVSNAPVHQDPTDHATSLMAGQGVAPTPVPARLLNTANTLLEYCQQEKTKTLVPTSSLGGISSTISGTGTTNGGGDEASPSLFLSQISQDTCSLDEALPILRTQLIPVVESMIHKWMIVSTTTTTMPSRAAALAATANNNNRNKSFNSSSGISDTTPPVTTATKPLIMPLQLIERMSCEGPGKVLPTTTTK